MFPDPLKMQLLIAWAANKYACYAIALQPTKQAYTCKTVIANKDINNLQLCSLPSLLSRFHDDYYQLIVGIG